MVTRATRLFACALGAGAVCAALGISIRAAAQPGSGPAPDDPSETGQIEAAEDRAPAGRRAHVPVVEAGPARTKPFLVARAPAGPALHHAPPAVAPAHEPLVVEAEIVRPELVRRALLVYVVPDNPLPREVEFRRGGLRYVASIPAQQMRWPSVAYAIELELLDGRREPVFASRTAFHSVEVPEDLTDVRERALLERLGGRRSVVSMSGDYVGFGKSFAEVTTAGGGFERREVNDRYYRIEGAYTFRPLRFVTEFSLRIGVVRGSSPVPIERELEPDEDASDLFDVGLNYGAPTVRIRLNDLFHLEGEFLTSVTEVGFSVGAGSALLIGDPYGSKLTLGFEAVEVFGNRFYSRMDIVAGRGVAVAPIIEVTNMPHADTYGVRLLGEVGVDVGQGFGVAVRGGYQARLSTSGGPSGGATLSYAF
jgi:hypothetical protein